MASTATEKEQTKATAEEKPKPTQRASENRVYFSTQQRVISRLVVVAGVLITIWYTVTRSGKEISLAKQGEVIEQRGQVFDCDPNYIEEIERFPSCVPQKCGRHVFDKIVTANEAEILLRIAKRGIGAGGSSGGASILDLHSGALSYKEKFINAYTLDEADRIFNAADLAVYKIVRAKIHENVAQTFNIDTEDLFLTHPTFFSRLTNLEPKTEHDEYWHIHVDKVTYESFHYTSLLYLTEHGSDFEGGRLVFLDGPRHKHDNVTVEPRPGRVVMFSSGADNPHYVERVTKGIRYALTVSFTCDPSKAINDPAPVTP